jgi:hypothetical protein
VAGQVVNAPTGMIAELEWACLLDMVHIPIGFIGTKLGEGAVEGLQQGVSPSGVAPSIARAFTGNDGRVGGTGVRLGGWGYYVPFTAKLCFHPKTSFHISSIHM